MGIFDRVKKVTNNQTTQQNNNKNSSGDNQEVVVTNESGGEKTTKQTKRTTKEIKEPKEPKVAKAKTLSEGDIKRIEKIFQSDLDFASSFTPKYTFYKKAVDRLTNILSKTQDRIADKEAKNKDLLVNYRSVQTIVDLYNTIKTGDVLHYLYNPNQGENFFSKNIKNKGVLEKAMKYYEKEGNSYVIQYPLHVSEGITSISGLGFTEEKPKVKYKKRNDIVLSEQDVIDSENMLKIVAYSNLSFLTALIVYVCSGKMNMVKIQKVINVAKKKFKVEKTTDKKTKSATTKIRQYQKDFIQNFVIPYLNYLIINGILSDFSETTTDKNISKLVFFVEINYAIEKMVEFANSLSEESRKKFEGLLLFNGGSLTNSMDIKQNMRGILVEGESVKRKQQNT
ncbi:MAG: hypothetical protein QXS90_01295 [Candidatus Diapherotrites archaeon]